MTMKEIILTIVDTAAYTSLIILGISSLAFLLRATIEWIKEEMKPEEELEIIDDK